jgi:hypothetical protein
MDFLDIASLGVAYRYVVKIELKFKQKRGEFGSAKSSQPKQGKGGPTHKTRDRAKMSTLRTTSPSRNPRRVMRSQRRTWENGVNTIKSLGTTPVTHYFGHLDDHLTRCVHVP